MNEWEKQITTWAEQFEYPPTPDVSRQVVERRPDRVARRPRMAWGMAVVIGLVASLLLVPEVRATAVAMLRAGGVTVYVGEQPTPAAIPEGIEVPSFMTEITVAEAVARAPELLTSAEKGVPDQVFAYEDGNPAVIVQIWLGDDGQADMALYYIIDAPQYAYKGAERIDETTVNENRAFWINGIHLFRVEGVWQEWRFIDSNVLVWWSAMETYRLESYLTLEEAVQAAESLVPLQEVLQDEE